MNIEDIKIVRLKNGEDIIGIVTTVDNHRLNILYPMIVEIGDVGMRQAYVMSSWLGPQLFKHNEVTLWDNDILFTAEPTEEFIDNFQKMVDKLTRFVTSMEIAEHIQEEDLLIEAMVEKDTSVIH